MMITMALCSCSEGSATDEPPAASVVSEQASARFEVLATMLQRALPMERSGGALSPVLPGKLTRQVSGRWRRPNPLFMEAVLPTRSRGALRLSAGPVTITVRAVGPRDVAAAIDKNSIVYEGAYPGADSIHLAEPHRVEEFILLHDEQAPRSFQYELKVIGNGKVRQLEGVVEALDGKGNAWLRLERPYVIDRAGERHAVVARLEGERVNLTLPPEARQYPLLLDPGWTTTGKMNSVRQRHTATLLSNSKVLVAGGAHMGELSSAELYDPASGTWTTTGSMKEARSLHTATLLGSSSVLVAGGYRTTNQLSSAELYNPVSGTWTSTGSMKDGRSSHTATLLSTSKVLVAGGIKSTSVINASAELYNPASNTWTPAGSMKTARRDHAAVDLGTGKVLVAGGFGAAALFTSELYDIASNTWATSGNMIVPRYDHAMVKLNSGDVLVTGGLGGGVLSSSELYDPLPGVWNPTAALKDGRSSATATLLNNAKVLVAGGYSSAALSSTEVYDPTSKTWSSAGVMSDARANHTATLLNNFKVLVAGGGVQSAELFDFTIGQACTGASQCASGFCVDGLCCDSLCAATCYACNVSSKEGICWPVKVNTFDVQANTPCVQPGACDGKGACRSYFGQVCFNNLSCASGICMDSRCCDSTCLTTCFSCNIKSKEGTCSPLTDNNDAGCNDACTSCVSGNCTPRAYGQQVTQGSKFCSGTLICDGYGECRKKIGEPCNHNKDCASGTCVDGRCCNNTCETTCYSCNVKGKEGTCSPMSGQRDTGCNEACISCTAGKCSPLTSGTQVTQGTKLCSGTSACDGKGACKKKIGQACNNSNDCASGVCVDGVCCITPCLTPCYACNIKGIEGTCSALVKQRDDGCNEACITCLAGVCTSLSLGEQVTQGAKLCSDTSVCDGKGECRKKTGQACTSSKDCASDICADGVCCKTACNKMCESCNIKGTEGTCTFHPADKDPDGECGGKNPYCDGKCDGKGSCTFPAKGKHCGTCKTCDGAGRCSSTPEDDANCGVINCDGLDTKCRDYMGIKTKRCDSLGNCKKPNDPSTCTLFNQLCTGVDAGIPGADAKAVNQDAGGGNGDEGGDCSLGSGRGGPAGPLPLLLLLAVMLARLRWARGLPSRRGRGRGPRP